MSTRHPYYNYNKLLSYNGCYNFLVGGRGLGKSFGAKLKAIKDALYRDDQFIYLRRYKSELTTARTTFFADVEYKFPNWDFRIVGGEAQASHIKNRANKKRVWKTLGYFMSLSTAQTQKSVAFPRVKLIIFDEFIIEKGALHYLPDESTMFNNLYSTVDRWTDKTTVLFLANSVSIMNPYFIEFGIRPDENKEFVVKDDGFVVCHFPEAAAFASSVYETRFGKFIKGTEYAQYSVGNAFDDNHEMLLADKDSKAIYKFSLECKNGTFSVWHSANEDEYYVQKKLPRNQLTFTLVAERMDAGKMLMTVADRPLAYLRTSFRSGKVNFDTPSTRNTFTEIFKR